MHPQQTGGWHTRSMVPSASALDRICSCAPHPSLPLLPGPHSQQVQRGHPQEAAGLQLGHSSPDQRAGDTQGRVAGGQLFPFTRPTPRPFLPIPPPWERQVLTIHLARTPTSLSPPHPSLPFKSQSSQHPLLPTSPAPEPSPSPGGPGLPTPPQAQGGPDTHSDSRVGEKFSGSSGEPSQRALSLEQEQLRGHLPFGGLQASTPASSSSKSSRMPAPPIPPHPHRASPAPFCPPSSATCCRYMAHARQHSIPPAGTRPPASPLLSTPFQPGLPLGVWCKFLVAVSCSLSP